jgi:hypothetical protein
MEVRVDYYHSECTDAAAEEGIQGYAEGGEITVR